MRSFKFDGKISDNSCRKYTASCYSKRKSAAEIDEIRRHAKSGRPLGRDRFIKGLEDRLGRILRIQRSGPKPKN